jgi:hypothetical protein
MVCLVISRILRASETLRIFVIPRKSSTACLRLIIETVFIDGLVPSETRLFRFATVAAVLDGAVSTRLLAATVRHGFLMIRLGELNGTSLRYISKSLSVVGDVTGGKRTIELRGICCAIAGRPKRKMCELKMYAKIGGV